MYNLLKRSFAIVALFVGSIGLSHASLISVSQSQEITENGQVFSFVFPGLVASDGSGGLFSFFARGDYTDPNNEIPTITLETLTGSLVLNDLGVVSNTIAGLSLFTNNTVAGGGGVDQTLDFVFQLSGSLLDSLLADSVISVGVVNSGGVTAQTSYTDFVQLSFEYQSQTAVSSPAVLSLIMFSIAFLAFRHKK